MDLLSRRMVSTEEKIGGETETETYEESEGVEKVKVSNNRVWSC